MCAVTEAVEQLATAGAKARGAVFTKREVVDFILDLTGYTADRPLHQLRLLEPSAGDGDFLLPAIDRLLAAAPAGISAGALAPAICAVEVHRATYFAMRERVRARLVSHGFAADAAETLADAWLIHGDFLLAPLDGAFDAVVGNPPYVRQELIADALMAEYRARYTTIYDRADLYIPFIERSLRSLTPSGRLCFICADRWMKNRYGGPLRQLVAEGYRLRAYVDMVDTPAFHTDVIAYPAITLITREPPGPTLIARRPSLSPTHLRALAQALTGTGGADVTVTELGRTGTAPWLFGAADRTALVRRLEAAFPTLEEAGCKVGIGVATGADQAFIGPFKTLDVEPDRKLPLAMTRDIAGGSVNWRGFGIVNPFGPDGKLVDLSRFPRLRRYLEARRDAIAGRHVAQKAPARWYRTIDKIDAPLAGRAKLLIPDIKGSAHVVYENDGLYPHHNLYYVIADAWELRALQAVLLSGVARLFVETYSTKMRGGYLRFQAQYLRRIRLPEWRSVPAALRRRLAAAALSGDLALCDHAAAELYGLNEAERDTLAEAA